MIKLKLLLTAGMTLCAATAFAGNGIDVNGAHYNLNLIGKRDCALLPDNSNGRRIQVLLNGGDNAEDLNGTLLLDMSKKNKIFLVQGDSFDVLDPTACDGALFQLPGPGTDGAFCYSIWIRALGKPDGYATMTTCAVDTLGTDSTADDVVVCSMASVPLDASTRPQKFTNVTKELTTITFISSTTGLETTVNIFDPGLYDYFWNYDNHGLRLAQLRFYGGACPQ